MAHDDTMRTWDGRIRKVVVSHYESRAACRTLPSVLSLFNRHHASEYAEQLVDAIAALHPEFAIDAVTAIRALAL